MIKEFLVVIIVLLMFIVGFDFGRSKTINVQPSIQPSIQQPSVQPSTQPQTQPPPLPPIVQTRRKPVRSDIDKWYESTPLGGDVFSAEDAAFVNHRYANFQKYTPKCPYGNGYSEIGNVSSNNRVFVLCAKPDEIQSMEDLYHNYYKYLVIDQNRLPIYLNSMQTELTQGQNIQIPGYDGNFKVNLTQQDPRMILPY